MKERVEKATPLRARIFEGHNDQSIDFVWSNPWEKREEIFAPVWWPAHPIEATAEVERIFEDTARFVEASRTDIPRLCALVERMHEALQLLNGSPAERLAFLHENNEPIGKEYGAETCEDDYWRRTIVYRALKDAERIAKGEEG